MSEPLLNARSERALQGVNPRLVAVVRRAAEIVSAQGTGLGMIVTEGLRTPARQAELVKAGASQTLNSKHLPAADGMSRAVDLAATVKGAVRWDWPLYQQLAAAMKQAAGEQGTAIVWGGDWRTLKDGPHFELAA